MGTSKRAAKSKSKSATPKRARASPPARSARIDPTPAIFVNYRRADCESAAQFLAEDLQRAFGKAQVFFDQRAIVPGAKWPAEIRRALQGAKVVLACIGTKWHQVQNETTGKARLDERGDWVRCELEGAKRQGIPVLPVLLDGRDELPRAAIETRRSLRYLNHIKPVVVRPGDERDGGLAAIKKAISGHGVTELPSSQQTAPAPADLLARYRAHVRAAHARLVPFFPELQDKLLADVCVEVAIEWEMAEEDTGEAHGRARDQRIAMPRFDRTKGTLRSVLAAQTERGQPARLVVLGEPGAGKSTLARNLARTLAEVETPDAPLPVFVALSRVGTAGFDPCLLAAQDALPSSPTQVAALAELLRTAAAVGRAVFLLDGLDEVDPERIASVADAIVALAQDVPSPIAVLARPIAVDGREVGRQFVRAFVQPLARAQQDELASKLLGAEDAQRFVAELTANQALAEMCRNPLLLTMAAMIAQRALLARRPMPTRRGQLYDHAIDLLLQRGYGKEPKKVRDPGAARAVLAALSLHLHEGGGEVWGRADLAKIVWQVRRADEDLNFQLERTWETNEAFLQDLGDNAGVLGPHDGQTAGWRYLHRSLREYLAAEQLAALGEAAWQPRIDAWAKEVKDARRDTGRERWGEVFALLCGLVEDPLVVLTAVRKVSPALARRALAALETLPAEAGLEFALADEDVDGDLLCALCRNWGIEGEPAQRLLMPYVKPKVPTERLASIWYVQESMGHRPERAAFFAACGRSVEGAPKLLAVSVPAGSFVMGSPATEAMRQESEGPQHPVQVGAFWLCQTAVTNEDYQRFDPEHRSRAGADVAQHPVVHVSWWDAYLFCRWLGDDVRLPTEAEWEYACRAGTTTPFSFGATITPEQVNCNVDDPYGDGAKQGLYRERTVPVGSLPANPWRLHEMHGNVWEWCQDVWHDSYEGAPADGSAWGEGGSGYRVVRGGSWFYYARYCRSGNRGLGQPGYRDDKAGFRPASSSPAPFTTSPPNLRVQTQADQPKQSRASSASGRATRANKKKP